MRQISDTSSPAHGLSSAEHITMQLDEHHARIQTVLKAQKPQFIIDMGAGSGRDSIMMDDFMKAVLPGRETHLLSMDADNMRVKDALAAYPKRFTPAFTADQVAHIHHNHKRIAYMCDELPALPRLGNVSNIKADFMLCHAVIMFIPAKDLASSFNRMVNCLANNGTLFLGFSSERPVYYETDQRHSVELVDLLVRDMDGIRVRSLPDLKDSQYDTKPERKFHWHYRIITKTP